MPAPEERARRKDILRQFRDIPTFYAPPGIPIKWRGHVVGWLRNWRVENWFNYGDWIPGETTATVDFLRTIELENEAVVTLMGRKGVVHALPEAGQIDIKIWPGLVNETE